MNKPMESNQQTALEWYIEQVDKLEEEDGYLDIDKLFWLKEDALQMEREQIVSAVHYGIRSPYMNIQTIHTQIEITKGEQYYNDTYGTEPSR